VPLCVLPQDGSVLRTLREVQEGGIKWALIGFRVEWTNVGRFSINCLPVNAMRVEVVKERKALAADEWAAVQAIRRILDRWKGGLSSQTGKADG